MIEKINKFRKNKIVNIVGKIVNTIVTLFVVLVVFIIFVQKFSNNNITVFGYRIFTIVSESMVPKYEIGDMILAKNVDVKDIKVKDDMVYLGNVDTYKDKFITHQVIKIDKENGKLKFHTKGIANDLEDPVVDSSQVYGVVIYKFVTLSFISMLINNLYGFYFLIFIPFALLLFLEILGVMEDRKKILKKNK